MRHRLILSLALLLAAMALWPRRSSFTSVALPPADSFAFRVTMGLGDKTATNWSGAVTFENASQIHVEGWRFLEPDRLSGDESTWRWKMTSEATALRAYQTQLLPADPPTSYKGLIVRGRGEQARLRFETAQGALAFSAAEAPFGERRSFLGGRVTVERLPASVLLSARPRQDDYPSMAVAPDGAVWAAWMSYHDGRDGILLARMKDGQWRGPVEVPETSGDIWAPQVGVDAAGRTWVVWSQQVEGNFDLYARSFHQDRWGEVARLTDDPLPDINPHMIRDGSGALWVAWQGFRGRHSNIFLRAYRDGKWDPPVRVTETAANDWFPQLAADPCGAGIPACPEDTRIWIVWDSYRNGNYDVYARSYDGKLGQELPVAASALYEGDASIAAARDGSVWVAYNTSSPNWGKDQGYLIRQRPVGVPLGANREVKVRVWRQGKWMEPATQPAESLPASDRSLNFIPRLLADRAGAVWLAFRHRYPKPPTAGVDTHAGFYWETYLTRYEGKRWVDATPVPSSWDRLSARYSLALSPANELWLAWSTDNRDFRSPNEPVWNAIHAARLPAATAVAPELVAASDPPAEVRPGHQDEAGDVQRLRSYRAQAGGRSMQILRGDMHRHTELSVDVSAPDGSVFDFFRYMLDVAQMDFSGPADHQGGGSYDYWWWFTQKLDDLYHVPGAYVPVFTYERSLAYPFGHKNIVHAYRGARIVPFFYKYEVRPWVKDAPGNDRYGVEGRSVVENESELLFEQLRQSKGIAMAHTSATYMGTDWHTWGKEVEPAVEIYQGARTVYEEPKGPGAAQKGVDDQHMRTQGYEPAGFVWNAWAKGYRLGVQASSDHGSTHLSYSMIYVERPTREGLLDAIRQRHMYGATDNILLDFRMGRAFMGDEITAAAVPPLEITVRGTAPVAKVVVVRNNRYIYTAEPRQPEVKLSYRDPGAGKGTHYYYVRVEQADGQLAWSSPIWIQVRP